MVSAAPYVPLLDASCPPPWPYPSCRCLGMEPSYTNCQSPPPPSPPPAPVGPLCPLEWYQWATVPVPGLDAAGARKLCNEQAAILNEFTRQAYEAGQFGPGYEGRPLSTAWSCVSTSQIGGDGLWLLHVSSVAWNCAEAYDVLRVARQQVSLKCMG